MGDKSNSNKVNVRKIGTDIVKFEAFALVQSPAGMRQVNSRRRNVRSDMMILFPSLCCNLSLAASLRTSIPERKGWYRMECHK